MHSYSHSHWNVLYWCSATDRLQLPFSSLALHQTFRLFVNWFAYCSVTAFFFSNKRTVCCLLFNNFVIPTNNTHEAERMTKVIINSSQVKEVSWTVCANKIVFFLCFYAVENVMNRNLQCKTVEGCINAHVRRYLTSIFFSACEMVFHLWIACNEIFEFFSIFHRWNVPFQSDDWLTFTWFMEIFHIFEFRKHHKCAGEHFVGRECAAFLRSWSLMPDKTLRIQLFRMKKMKFYYTKYEMRIECSRSHTL